MTYGVRQFSDSSQNRRSASQLLALVLLGCVLMGCGGGDELPKFHVSGKVTFAGQPIKFGTIVFDPDRSNPGPQGTAEIHDGAYDTKKQGQGVIPGKFIVRITGFDKAGDPSSETPNTPLFEEYAVPTNLATNDNKKDFDVPKSSGGSPPGAAPGNAGP